MAYSEQEVAQLILKYFSDELNPSEKVALENWLAASPGNRQFFDGLENEDDLLHLLALEESDKKNNVQQRILEKIQDRINVGDEPVPAVVKISAARILGMPRRFWYAAASVLFVLSITLFYLSKPSNKEQQKQLVLVNTAEDVLPGSEKAILTLSNGQQVELSADKGQVIKDGDLAIANDNGELKYAQSDAAVFNTMTTPKGGQFKVTLADGTKVRLNAASSITYPTVFSGATREVSITGEVYFEVQRDKSKRFIVQTPGGAKVEVLGTHFNVNTYADEAYQATTLVEGKVRVVKLDEAVNLEPGLQAKVFNSKGVSAGKNIAVSEADVEEATAWKNNLFFFNKTEFPLIMRQLVRWYDLDIRYKGEAPKRSFSGKIPRNIPLSQMLSTLKLVGVNFEIKDKTLVVSGSGVDQPQP